MKLEGITFGLLIYERLLAKAIQIIQEQSLTIYEIKTLGMECDKNNRIMLRLNITVGFVPFVGNNAKADMIKCILDQCNGVDERA